MLVLQSIAGIALGLAVGAFCRWFDIPSPAPPRIIGALILIAMTLGFLAGGWVVAAP
jgi:XapX domain-containing protein